MKEQPRLEVEEFPWAHALRDAVEEMYGHRLELLHEWPHLAMIPTDGNRDEDQASRAHAQFYRLFPRMEELYRTHVQVLGELALPGETFFIQRVPNIRFQFPRSRAVGEPHTDWQYGHQFGEVSFWIPLTEAHYSSTMWVAERAQGWDPAEYHQRVVDEEEGGPPAFESLPDPVRMFPVNLSVGQVLVWDSVTRAHANLLNREGLTEMLELDLGGELRTITGEEGAVLVDALKGEPLKIRRNWWDGRGTTRVSLDFRVLPKRLYEPDTQRVAVNTGVPMTLGTEEKPGYWTDPEVWL